MNLLKSFAVILLVTCLSACSILKPTKPSTAQTVKPPTNAQLDLTRADIQITNLLASIKPAEVEFTSKVLTPEQEKLYNSAVGAYNRLSKTWTDYHNAASLGVKLDTVKERWKADLENCQVLVFQLQRGRGVKP